MRWSYMECELYKTNKIEFFNKNIIKNYTLNVIIVSHVSNAAIIVPLF